MSFWSFVRVVAYRDFKAVVMTPLFLVFLFLPVVFFVIGGASGAGLALVEQSAKEKAQIGVLLDRGDTDILQKADASLRAKSAELDPIPSLVILPSHGASNDAVARKLVAQEEGGYKAVLYGPVDRPTIISASRGSADYLADLAEQAARSKASGIAPDARLSRAQIIRIDSAGRDADMRRVLGQMSVLLIFVLTLMLSSQAIGTLAEEKANKIIEVLTAAAPLEAIFFGKLLATFGVALLFVGFWVGLGQIGLSGLSQRLDLGALTDLTPAVGMAAYAGLMLAYFTLAFLLLGALFLGIGAQANDMRDVQLLSLPLTLVEMGLFVFASAGAAQPDSTLALAAEIFPLSSPMAMAGRAAVDPALWPHLLALAWQTIWVAIIVLFSARLFRRGVLKSGPSPSWIRRWKKT